MTKRDTYQHYCSVARALERVGDRWTLLIIRDLLRGPHRFGELRALLARITPRQLSARLKSLEADGLVRRTTEPGRKQVTYGLTAEGRTLRGVIHALTDWGVQHAWGPPRESENVHPEHLMHGAAVMLTRGELAPPQNTRWQFHFPEHPSLALVWNGDHWWVDPERRPNDEGASLVIHAEPRVLAELIFDPERLPALLGRGIEVHGDAQHLQTLMTFAMSMARSSTSPETPP